MFARFVFFCKFMADTADHRGVAIRLRGKVLAKNCFKIIDKNHLLLFSGMWVVSKKEDVPDPYDVLYEFVPAKNLPPSTSFGCKLNKYMWENKADWKAYKQIMKQQRKNKEKR